MDYADQAINEMRASLRATSVISSDYSSLLLSYALTGVGEAYRRGVAKGEENATQKEQ